MPGHEDRINGHAPAFSPSAAGELGSRPRLSPVVTADGPSGAMQRMIETMANGSDRVARVQHIQTMADRGTTANGVVSQRVAQRVLIDGVDITKDTPIDTIVQVLAWNSLRGTTRDLSDQQKRDLITELKGRKDCERLLDDLADDEDDDEVQHDLQAEDDDDINALVDERLRETRRRLAAEAFGWEGFPEAVNGLIKLGVHETGVANVSRLVALGPLNKLVGTGRGSGKGAGFYITHVGKKTLFNATKGIEYGESFVAVYVPNTLKRIKSESEEENNVDVLAKLHPESRYCYYVMEGGSEIVVPTWCFDQITVVARPEQLGESKEHRRVVWNTYEDELWYADKLNELSSAYNLAQEERSRKRLAEQWNRLQKTLFFHWSSNASLNTLWLDTSQVGVMVSKPSPPSFN